VVARFGIVLVCDSVLLLIIIGVSGVHDDVVVDIVSDVVCGAFLVD